MMRLLDEQGIWELSFQHWEGASSPCLLLHRTLISAIVSGRHGLWTNGRSYGLSWGWGRVKTCKRWWRAAQQPASCYVRRWALLLALCRCSSKKKKLYLDLKNSHFLFFIFFFHDHHHLAALFSSIFCSCSHHNSIPMAVSQMTEDLWLLWMLFLRFCCSAVFLPKYLTNPGNGTGCLSPGEQYRVRKGMLIGMTSSLRLVVKPQCGVGIWAHPPLVSAQKMVWLHGCIHWE